MCPDDLPDYSSKPSTPDPSPPASPDNPKLGMPAAEEPKESLSVEALLARMQVLQQRALELKQELRSKEASYRELRWQNQQLHGEIALWEQKAGQHQAELRHVEEDCLHREIQSAMRSMLGQTVVPTAIGGVAVRMVQSLDKAAASFAILLLDACINAAAQTEPLVERLLQSDCGVLLVETPGYGRSSNAYLPEDTLEMHDSTGPLQIVRKIAAFFEVSPKLLIGVGAGATIALSAALQLEAAPRLVMVAPPDDCSVLPYQDLGQDTLSVCCKENTIFAAGLSCKVKTFDCDSSSTISLIELAVDSICDFASETLQ